LHSGGFPATNKAQSFQAVNSQLDPSLAADGKHGETYFVDTGGELFTRRLVQGKNQGAQGVELLYVS